MSRGIEKSRPQVLLRRGPALTREDLSLYMKYAIPSMFSMFIAGSFCLIDTIFVGRWIGEVGLAALGLVWPIVFFFHAVGDMFGTGAAVLIAQARGEKNATKAQESFNGLLWFQIASVFFLIIPCILFLPTILRLLGTTPILMPQALEYIHPMLIGSWAAIFVIGGTVVIRNDGKPLWAMWIKIFALSANLFLDWFFIFHLRWGACGAAWATVASHLMACLLILWYFLSSHTRLRLRPFAGIPSLKTIRSIFVTGIPTFGNMMTIMVMLLLHNAQALRCQGEAGLAAMMLISTLQTFGSLLLTGLAAGLQPIAAFLHGAQEHRRKRRIAQLTALLSLALGLILMLGSLAFRQQMPAIVGLKGHSAELALHGVFFVAATFLLLGLQRVACVYYQATKQIGKSAFLIYGDGFLVLPLCLYFLPKWFAMDGVWAAMPISRVILFFMLALLWAWNHPKKIWLYQLRISRLWNAFNASRKT